MSRSQTKASHRQLHSEKKQTNPLYAILISTICGTAILFISIIVFSFILQKSPDPSLLTEVVAVISSVLSGGCAGIIASKLTRRPVPWSIISGIAMLIIYFIVSLFVKANDAPDTVFSAVNSASVIVSGLLFGFLSSKNKKKRKVR